MKTCFVIAEAGVNHNGSLETALEMVDTAKKVGADAIKFQSFNASALATNRAGKADYQKKSTPGFEGGQLSMLQKLELSKDDQLRVIDRCREQEIEFLSAAFDLESLEFLLDQKLPRIKIPSGEILNTPYLRRVAQGSSKVILSTGMADLFEVAFAVKTLTESGLDRSRLCLLHCNTEYPTPFEDVNLLAMPQLGNSFGTSFGYSDHTEGIEIAIAAVAMGATCIEKHFTLDRRQGGPDHAASLEARCFESMVRAIRNIQVGLGDSIKRPSKSEEKNKIPARKSLVAKCAIHKGEAFSEKNLTVKRPGDGLSPMFWDQVVGSIASKDYEEDELV